MKSIAQLLLAALPWLLFLLTPKGFCIQRVHCQWGPYGDWSECDGCTKLQTRSRPMAVYAQFGGNPCDGKRTETRSCETTKGCPLEDGCGDRFRCRSGKCIIRSLMCNGDQDCEEDGHDELGCDVGKYIVCVNSALPPNVELLGLGFDVVTGERRASVINTKSFGGQCRNIFSGVHNTIYRLPLSTIQYSFMMDLQSAAVDAQIQTVQTCDQASQQLVASTCLNYVTAATESLLIWQGAGAFQDLEVKVENDFSDEMYQSKWHFAKETITRETLSGTTSGYRNYNFLQTYDKSQAQKLVVLKSEIEVTQFQSNSHQYLPISEEFWKALVKLPSVYDYDAYRKVLESFGTHYLSEGSLGGSFKLIAKIDEETERWFESESHQSQECVRTQRWFLFFRLSDRVDCTSSQGGYSRSSGNTRGNNIQRVDVQGGGISQVAALKGIQASDPDNNWERFSNWADSVRSFPQVTKQTLRPLSELVKEVQCAGVKKIYLRRAIEQYLSETDTCHCQPCSNNGLVVRNGDKCECICKPGTSGLACEHGTEVEGQQGVIHGSWACWSDWSSCSGGKRSRSRSCSNPTPQNGGQHCSGEPTETSDCGDEDLEYLKTMEPQCFDQTLPASLTCGPPPTLINGYILVPKDVYLVGSKVEYTCTIGLYLIGESTLECTANQTWSSGPGLCTVSRCHLDSLADGVIATPSQPVYGIGETVTLSCPEGRQVVGEATIICTPSLQFSPDPASITCSPAVVPQQHLLPLVQCKSWEKSSRGQCVCKMPFECGASLEVCATAARARKSILLNVCKMHALQCMGKSYTIADDSTCKWPERNTAGCTNCHMWETCDDQTNECRCRDAADCSNQGADVCVRVGQNATAASQTMSECEAGLQRCKGEEVSVLSILPCAAA